MPLTTQVFGWLYHECDQEETTVASGGGGISRWDDSSSATTSVISSTEGIVPSTPSLTCDVPADPDSVSIERVASKVR
jgi:hypothetical protein